MYNIDDIYSYANIDEKKFTVDYSISVDRNNVPFITVSYITPDGKQANIASNSKDLDMVSRSAGYYARKTYSNSYSQGEKFIPIYYDPTTKKFSNNHIGHSKHEIGELHDDFPVGYLFDKDLLNKLDTTSRIEELSNQLHYLYNKNNLDLQNYNIQFSINDKTVLSKNGDQEMTREQIQYAYKVIAEFVGAVLNQQYSNTTDFKMSK